MSESEEMYLITIAHLKEEGFPEPVPLSRLAAELSVAQGSANQMVRKLEISGLLRYLPYNGVTLTASGVEIAAKVMRHRRLWESFLIDCLGLSFKDADALACRMEHITSEPVADMLSSYLGDPEVTPSGKPIPKNIGGFQVEQHTPMSSLEVGKKGTVEFIEADCRVIQFLGFEGLHRGAEVVVLARGDTGSLLVESHEKEISLSPELASSIHVRIVPDHAIADSSSSVLRRSITHGSSK